MTGESFIDVDCCQQSKAGQYVSGDVFASRKIKEESRVLAVLSDGLGSGVKASVLANLTATMALRYTAAFIDVRKSAETIMDTLPVCEVTRVLVGYRGADFLPRSFQFDRREELGDVLHLQCLCHAT